MLPAPRALYACIVADRFASQMPVPDGPMAVSIRSFYFRYVNNRYRAEETDSIEVIFLTTWFVPAFLGVLNKNNPPRDICGLLHAVE